MKCVCVFTFKSILISEQNVTKLFFEDILKGKNYQVYHKYIYIHK